MRARFFLWLAMTGLVAASPLAACSSSTKDPATLPTSDDDASPRTRPDVGTDTTADGAHGFDSGPGAGRVYAHTTDTLYLFEPFSKKLTKIGKLSCLAPGEPMIDIAVDRTGAMYGTSFGNFFSIDPVTASCTRVASSQSADDYPNGMSFVPAGTVDKTKETLVGYTSKSLGPTVADQYVKIDTQTGAMTLIGNMNPPSATTKYKSSGDIISLAQDGNRTFVTVQTQGDAGPATDLLAEVDPATGVIKRIVGDTKQAEIYGLGYWAGKGYGFSSDGHVVEIDMVKGTSTLVTTLTNDAGAPVPWYGAGVTTQAPITP
jgi:hypothetical protein